MDFSSLDFSKSVFQNFRKNRVWNRSQKFFERVKPLLRLASPGLTGLELNPGLLLQSQTSFRYRSSDKLIIQFSKLFILGESSIHEFGDTLK